MRELGCDAERGSREGEQDGPLREAGTVGEIGAVGEGRGGGMVQGLAGRSPAGARGASVEARGAQLGAPGRIGGAGAPRDC